MVSPSKRERVSKPSSFVLNTCEKLTKAKTGDELWVDSMEVIGNFVESSLSSVMRRDPNQRRLRIEKG